LRKASTLQKRGSRKNGRTVDLIAEKNNRLSGGEWDRTRGEFREPGAGELKVSNAGSSNREIQGADVVEPLQILISPHP